MAIFAKKKIQYLTFYITLTDPEKVKQFQTQFPVGVNRAIFNAGPPPGGASVEFNAPFRGYTEPDGSSAPFTWTPWSGVDSPQGPYPINVAVFTRHSGGFLGIGGTDTKYYWMGQFVLAANPDGPKTDTNGNPLPINPMTGKVITTNMAARRWVEGFECGTGLVFPAAGFYPSREASRHVGGIGAAQRGATGGAVNKTVSGSPAKSWERLYLRLRKKDATLDIRFWRARSSVADSAGVVMAISPLAEIKIYTVDSLDTFTLRATVGGRLDVWNGLVTHDAWVRLDMLIEFDAGRFRLFIRGGQVADVQASLGGGGHSRTQVGMDVAAANTLHLDLDDWLNAAIPTDSEGAESLTGKDFLNGSSIRLARPKGYSANHAAAAWAGDFRVLMQNPVGSAPTTPATIATTVASALAAVDADADLVVDAEPGALGVAAMTVAALTQRGTLDGQLGAKLSGAAPVMNAVTESGAGLAYVSTIVQVSAGGTIFVDVTPLELRYQKGADGTQALAAQLLGQVELIGLFGPEDYRAAEIGTAPDAPAPLGTHNAPYPRSQWAREARSAPIAPYIIQTGTYVGNGSGQDLTFRAPIHWFFVRPLTGNTGGYFWLSSALASHKTWNQGVAPQIADAQEDPTFAGAAGEDTQQQRYRLRLAGSDAQLNATGVTYQYVAIADPGMRFMLNGAIAPKINGPIYVTNLVNAEFLAGFAFLIAEGANADANPKVYAKGPGQAVASIVAFDGGATATALTFGTGRLTTDTGAHNLGNTNFDLIYSLWRRADGNTDPGEPAVVVFGSYTGDGSGSRVINLTPTSGKRPIFAMVFSEAAAPDKGYWRDPSHTGTNSSKRGGTETATGITAGAVDSFTVGVDLNTNGIVYTYFALVGSAVAGNNGWGVNGEFIPVEANSPEDGPWPDDPPEPVTVPSVIVPLTSEPDLDTTTIVSTTATNVGGLLGGQVCEVYTRAIVNMALKRVGVSKRIANLVSDTSEEAITARDLVTDAVNQVLRDFPWPFATAYANLVLVGGTVTVPVNTDWQYSYRAPNAMIFARRIVGQADQRRAHDPKPIPFRLGGDATGPLIFTNAPATTLVPVVLEYTTRNACPAFYGDALFRDALAWKLAAMLAAPLARDLKKEQFALGMYQQALRNAEAPAASEQQHEKEGDADWISGRD